MSVALDELRLETLLPADETTQKTLTKWADPNRCVGAQGTPICPPLTDGRAIADTSEGLSPTESAPREPMTPIPSAARNNSSPSDEGAKKGEVQMRALRASGAEGVAGTAEITRSGVATTLQQEVAPALQFLEQQ